MALEQKNLGRRPEWLRVKLPSGGNFQHVQQMMRGHLLHTVCEEAGCPNIFECWEDREATFLIGGEVCTRRCDFCQIDTGKPAEFDAGEPVRVAESVRKMGLRYATVTGVWPEKPATKMVATAAMRTDRWSALPRPDATAARARMQSGTALVRYAMMLPVERSISR